MNSIQSRVTISVVIPTINRHELVIRAIRSVLSQTLQPIEIIVVIDGPDENTLACLEKLRISHLKALSNSTSLGGSESRNIGVRAARGDWIAFLDDDDEWFPTKLERQLYVAKQSLFNWPVVSNKLIARTPKGDYVWPTKDPDSSIPISEYLFVRDGFFKGEGLLQTSTLFAPRDLLIQNPFNVDLEAHEDWDWLIRSSQSPAVNFEFVSEPLSIWYTEENRQTTSQRTTWQYSLSWVNQNRPLISDRAYAGFIVTIVTPLAAKDRDYSAFWLLFRSTFIQGDGRFHDFILFLIMWLVPLELRHLFRKFRTIKLE
jgi:glycosyltransferase involved in cell wall biosynthesis